MVNEIHGYFYSCFVILREIPNLSERDTFGIIVDKSLSTFGRLLLQGDSRWQNWKGQYERMLMHTANYFRVSDCEYDAAKWIWAIRKTTSKRNFMKGYLYTDQWKTNSIITDVIFGGGWCSRVVANQEDSFYCSSR